MGTAALGISDTLQRETFYCSGACSGTTPETHGRVSPARKVGICSAPCGSVRFSRAASVLRTRDLNIPRGLAGMFISEMDRFPKRIACSSVTLAIPLFSREASTYKVTDRMVLFTVLCATKMGTRFPSTPLQSGTATSAHADRCGIWMWFMIGDWLELLGIEFERLTTTISWRTFPFDRGATQNPLDRSAI